jgi:WhiB family redox-sensing transcriptional regulator
MSVMPIPAQEPNPQDDDEIIRWPRRSRNNNTSWELASLLRLHNRRWVRRARCLRLDPNIFFPEGGGLGIAQEKEAKEICYQCPVRLDCLAWAIQAGENIGIYGGTNARERRRLRRKYPGGVTRELMVQFYGINVEQPHREQIRNRIQPVQTTTEHR